MLLTRILDDATPLTLVCNACLSRGGGDTLLRQYKFTYIPRRMVFPAGSRLCRLLSFGVSAARRNAAMVTCYG